MFDHETIMPQPVPKAAGKFRIVFDEKDANDSFPPIQGNSAKFECTGIQLIFRFQSA